MNKTVCSEKAQICWDENGLPVSSVFDDVYFSKANGLEETRYVFIEQNALISRWQTLDQNESFTIGETGFGTGLNFLAAWELWNRLTHSSNHLHFISVEKFPLSPADLKRSLALWPQLADLANTLLEHYPIAPVNGFHRLTVADNVSLTLIVGDAAEALEQLLRSDHPLYERPVNGVQAWFLDGFAPSKNPDMWTETIFSLLNRVSAPGATLSTFTAAGIVRRGLEKAGFTVEKVPGFGHKRDMLRARLAAAVQADSSQFKPGAYASPHSPPWSVSLPCESEKSAVIIGGGLAGCHSAHALAQRGWQVTIIEKQPRLALGGSGNPQGILYAKLSLQQGPLETFNLTALLHALRFYRPFWAADMTRPDAESTKPPVGQRCGVIQLSPTPEREQVHQQLSNLFSAYPAFTHYLTKEQASQTAGIAMQSGGLYFPDAGWLSPARLCEQLTQHPAITHRFDTEVRSLTYNHERWHLLDSHDQVITTAANVVISSAFDATRLTQTQHLPLRKIRGQVTFLPEQVLSSQLRTAVCSEGYIAPPVNNQHCLGATFNLKDYEPQLRPGDHQKNLTQLGDYAPALAQQFSHLNPEQLQGRVGFRCTAPDYLPLVGQVPVHHDFLKTYALLRKNARASIPSLGQYYPGLYINVGYGSRGLAYTPLCAQLLADTMQGDFLPLSRDLVTALNPARFIIRDLIRNKC